MRMLIAVAAMLAATTVQATEPVITFEQTVAAYGRGDHELARERFGQHSKLGFPEAQFNYGLMLMRGEGGEQDREQGRAWLALAAEQGYQPAAEAAETLGLDTTSMSAPVAEYAMAALVESYRPDVSVCDSESLDPVTLCGKGTEMERSEAAAARAIGRHQPTYPRNAAVSGVTGFAKLRFWLDEHGRPVDVHVQQSFPTGVFESASIDALRRWRFDPDLVDDTSDHPPITQVLEFSLTDGLPHSSGPREHVPLVDGVLRDNFDRLRGASDPASQFAADLMAEYLRMPERKDAAAFLESAYTVAVFEHTEAQRVLAARCPQLAEYWLARAAFAGDAPSQFAYARLYGSDKRTASAMLKASALAGYEPALVARLREIVAGELTPERAELERLIEARPSKIRGYTAPVYANAQELLESMPQSEG